MRPSVEAMVRGYHVYKDIWSAVVGTELPCKREDANRIDPFAVAIVQGAIVVGHVPKKISSVCLLFLRRGGSIVCRVTGSRRYSEDLMQGGFEIPCVLRFEGDAKHSAKAKNLVESALAVTATDLLPKKLTDVPADLPAVDSNEVPTPEPNKNKAEWVRLSSIELTKTEKECILAGEKLNDLHISMAQGLLKQQFPDITELRSPLLQGKKQLKAQDSEQKIQIIHCHGNHWIVASNILAASGKVKVTILFIVHLIRQQGRSFQMFSRV